MAGKPKRVTRIRPIIRLGRQDDLESLVGLLGQLFALEGDFSVDPVRQRKGLRLMLRPGPSRTVYVAQVGSDVVGMCTAQVVISTAEGGPAAWVEDVVVDRRFRGLGIGRKLLAALDGWARKKGIGRLQLLADRENFPALDFYSRQGWLPTRLVCLRHRVTSGETRS